MSESPRIIKKYPNRRLYDTGISSYITLEGVRQLVREGVDFRIEEARDASKDLTRGVLLQIIAEQEYQGQPLFSTRLLTQLIRFYGGSMQGILGEYLQKSLDLFVAQQQYFQSQFQRMIASNPMDALSVLAERNLKLWREMQESFFQQAGAHTPPRQDDPAPATAREQPRGEGNGPRDRSS